MSRLGKVGITNLVSKLCSKDDIIQQVSCSKHDIIQQVSWRCQTNKYFWPWFPAEYHAFYVPPIPWNGPLLGTREWTMTATNCFGIRSVLL